MKKLWITLVIAGLAANGFAQNFNAGINLKSAYISRGATFNDGPVIQGYAEVANIPMPGNTGSLTVGLWANYDINDFSATYSEAQDGTVSEIDWYLTYCAPFEAVDLSITYTEYTYPHGTTTDKEVIVTLGKAIAETGLYASFSAYYGIDDAYYDNSWYLKAALDYEKALTEKLTGTLGASVAYDMADTRQNGWNDASLSVGASYALTEHLSLNGSLAYIAQLDDDILINAEHQVDLLSSIGLSVSF